jgi:ABC-type anion transport system duplicated permease subunit
LALAQGALVGAVKYFSVLMTLTGGEWLGLLASTAVTFPRVVIAVVLASLWTIPVGVMIGRHARWSRVLQPVIQMAASFPAPMIFPVVVGAMLAFGTGLGTSSVVLLLLGTQWYILFNVIAGTLRGLFAFDLIVQALQQSAGDKVDEALVLSRLARAFPGEPPPRILRTVVAWARYAELFKYSSLRRVLHGLQKPR